MSEQDELNQFSNKYLNWYNGLSKIVRILLCILWDIPSNLVRLSKSIIKKNTLGIILAVVLMIFGGFLLFIIDIICIAVKDKVYWLDDLGLEEAAPADEQKAEEQPVADQPEAPADDAKNGTVD